VKPENVRPEDLEWRCDRCRRELVVGPVVLSYMNNRFTTELPYCPVCKTVLISDVVATGKMADVERILEDK